jgi:hypothetical protein
LRLNLFLQARTRNLPALTAWDFYSIDLHLAALAERALLGVGEGGAVAALLDAARVELPVLLPEKE